MLRCQNCLITFIFITFLPSSNKAQDAVTTKKEERASIIFQNRKRPNKTSVHYLPAVVRCKINWHSNKQFYVLEGGKDSMLMLIPLRMRRKFLSLSYKMDTGVIKIPFNSIYKITFRKSAERYGYWKSFAAFSPAYAAELFTIIFLSEGKGPNYDLSALACLVGASIAAELYTTSVIKPEEWRIEQTSFIEATKESMPSMYKSVVPQKAKK